MLSGRIRGYRIPLHVLCAFAVILIFIYGFFVRHYKIRDVLEKNVIENEGLKLDGWGILHILFFMFIGYLQPNHNLAALLYGIGWELFETLLGQCKIMVGGVRLKLIGDQLADGTPTGNDESYWYGRQSDITMNMTGYIIGESLSLLKKAREADEPLK